MALLGAVYRATKWHRGVDSVSCQHAKRLVAVILLLMGAS